MYFIVKESQIKPDDIKKKEYNSNNFTALHTHSIHLSVDILRQVAQKGEDS